MTTYSSNIDTATIDATYPVAGQDNDTQGFRDNFSHIKTALNQAKLEITELQNYSVLKAAVDTTNHTMVENDLSGSTIKNGIFNKFYGTANLPSTVYTAGSIEVDLTKGIAQRFILGSDTSLTFKNWPPAGQYAKVIVHLTLDPSAPSEISQVLVNPSNIVSEGNGSKYKEPDFPTLHVVKNSEIVFEAWSFNNGATFYIKYIGEFVAGV